MENQGTGYDKERNVNQIGSKISTPQGGTKKSPPLSQPTEWFVYLIRCSDQSLYCGITTDLKKRIRQHNGELVGGAKYTQARQPCQLVYSEPALNRSEASKREADIKKLAKSDKEALVLS